MSFISRLMALFPVTVLALFLFALVEFVKHPTFLTVWYPIIIIYFYPVCFFRFINLFFPLKEGISDIGAKAYNPWWGSHMIQIVYYACPWFESLLRIIPGAYSFWLRLWGSKIGKNVYWTPNIEVDDRSMLVMGNNCIVGHKLHFLPHVITPRGGKMSLLLKKITIGNDCFLGAGSRLGPGVSLEDKTSIPILTDGQINQHFKTGNHIKKTESTQ